MTRSEPRPQQTDDERAEILRRVQRRAGLQPLKSQAEIDAEAWPAKRRLFAIAATCGAVLTAILIAVDPIRWVLP